MEPFAERGTRNGDRVDAVGLAALTPAAAGVSHQPRRSAENAFSALDQKTLERSRHVPVCERLCMSAPSTIMVLVPFTSTESGHPADMACWGRCHAPIKSRRDIPDRRRATQRADRVKASQLAVGRSLIARPDVTAPIQTASVEATQIWLARRRRDRRRR